MIALGGRELHSICTKEMASAYFMGEVQVTSSSEGI
jgi:hypothetical protein